MKTPGWAIFVGIMMLLMGGCGVINSIGTLSTPKQLAMMEEFMRQAAEADSSFTYVDSLGTGTTIDIEGEELSEDELEMMGKFLHISDYRMTWMLRFAKYGMFVFGLIIMGGIALFMKKTWSLRVAYIALLVVLLFSILQIYIYSKDPDAGLISAMGYIPIAISILLAVVSLVVIATSDKMAYLPDTYEEYED